MVARQNNGLILSMFNEHERSCQNYSMYQILSEYRIDIVYSDSDHKD